MLLCILISYNFIRVDKIPRWSGLNHFSAVMKQEFTDGSKYEDIAKVCYNLVACQCFALLLWINDMFSSGHYVFLPQPLDGRNFSCWIYFTSTSTELS
jgi:hypothetical protein